MGLAGTAATWLEAGDRPSHRAGVTKVCGGVPAGWRRWSSSDHAWVTDPLSLWSSAVGTLIAEVAALGLAIAFTSPVSVVTVILLLSMSTAGVAHFRSLPDG